MKKYRLHYPWMVKHLKSYRYTVDLNPKMKPDLVGNIMSKEDLSSLPDNFFDSVIFEFVLCTAYMETDTFDTIYRVLKPGGTFYGDVAFHCARLVPFVIENTPFQGQQTYDILKFPKDVSGFWDEPFTMFWPYEWDRLSSFVFKKVSS